MGRRSDHTPAELRRLALDAARQIVRSDGLHALTTRAIAKKIGYSAGTLYQHFKNLDDLIEQMNAETLASLKAQCDEVEFGADPAANLQALVGKYGVFTTDHPNEWAAIFEHKRPKGVVRSEFYNERVRKLYGIVEQAIAPFYSIGQESRRLHDARILWAFLFGISTLARDSLISAEESVESMVETVLEIFVLARGKVRGGEAAE